MKRTIFITIVSVLFLCSIGHCEEFEVFVQEASEVVGDQDAFVVDQTFEPEETADQKPDVIIYGVIEDDDSVYH